MGLPDMYSITVEGAKNFTASIQSEERARMLWFSKWGWIVDEHRKISAELAELKSKRAFEEEEVIEHVTRVPPPLSDTEGHMYGYLLDKPEFKLEIFPTMGLTKLPKKLTPKMMYDAIDERMKRLCTRAWK